MSTRTTTGSPVGRESGIGNVNPTMIRERAAELAAIDGRGEDDIAQRDFDLAREELQAELRPPSVQTAEKGTATSTDPAEPPASTGRARTESDADDTYQNHAAELVEEGIEEAVHDEMVESGKRTLREGAESTEDER